VEEKRIGRIAPAGCSVCVVWIVACAVAVTACKSKRANDSKKANPNKTTASKGLVRDAAVKHPLPNNTAGAGFSLPDVAPGKVDKGITVVDRGKGKPVAVSLAFKAGDKQTIEALMNARLGKHEGRSSLSYRTEVVAVDATSQMATLKLTFDKLVISSKPDQARSAEMAKLAKKVNGQSVVAKLSATGNATITSTDPQLAAIFPKLNINPARLFTHMYPRFPKGNLGIGAKWLTQLKTENNGKVETIDLTYELATAVKDPRGLMVTLDMVGKLATKGSDGAKASGNLRGQLVLIPSRGFIVKATMRQDTTVKAGNQAVRMSMLVDVIEKLTP